MTLHEYIGFNPDIWGFVAGDPVAFVNRLEADGFLEPGEYYPLMEEARKMAGVPILPAEKVRATAQRVGLAVWNVIKDFYYTMWVDVWNVLVDIMPKILAKTTAYIDEYNAKITAWYTEKVMPSPEEIDKLPPWIRDDVKRLSGAPSFMTYVWITLYILLWKIGIAISFIPIISKDAIRSLNKEYSPSLPDIATLIRYYFRAKGEEARVYDLAAQQGFDKAEVDIFLKTFVPLFRVDELRNLYLRGLVDDDGVNTELEKQGWDSAGIEKIKAAFWLIPGPTDLVRFSVREAYYPDYVEKYGLDQEYPEAFETDAKTVGVSPYWSKMYWRSHWELPPLAAAYDMLHRGVIESGELADLFKAQDIMPYWRKKLEAISYRVLTRVDVRRMYKVGTLDREGVKRAYLNVGYNDEDAELMTDFTIKWVTDDERDLTKTDILSAYQRRLFSRGEAADALRGLGYDMAEAELLVSRIDYDLEKKKKAAMLKNLEKAYKKGVYSITTVQDKLGPLNMTGPEITELIALWDAEKKDDTQALSKADLDRLYDKRVITEEIYREEMDKLRYIPRDIDWMVALHKAR